MKYLFTDRRGSQSIWGLMNPIAARLIARGDEVTYCRLDDGRQVQPPEAPDGVLLVDIDVPPKRRLWDIYPQQKAFGRQFGELLRQVRPDVVHTNFCVPGIAARVVARRCGVPFVVSTQHETYGSMHPHYRWAVRWTERYADAITYVSQNVARSFGRPCEPFAAGHGVAPARHSVIYNGVDLAKIHAIAREAGPRQRHKLVCAGRLVKVKGQTLLLRAMPMILSRFPDTRLVLIGSGPEEAALRHLAEKLCLSARVQFAGWLTHEQTIREMASAEAVVVPSRGSQEGFGLVAAEAAACGTPLVVGRIAVFEEILGADAKRALFIERRSPQAIADAVYRSFTLPRRAATRAANALRHVRERFAIERMVDDYVELYDSVAATRRHHASLRVPSPLEDNACESVCC